MEQDSNTVRGRSGTSRRNDSGLTSEPAHPEIRAEDTVAGDDRSGREEEAGERGFQKSDLSSGSE